MTIRYQSPDPDRSVDVIFRAAVNGASCWARNHRGHVRELPMTRWIGGLDAAPHDQLADAHVLGHCSGRPTLDLGCGPGSLSVRLLDRMPAARVVAIDTDPVLLALGRAAYGQRDGLRFVDVDLRSNGWTAALGLDRPADAAVSTTALHWLQPDALHLMYARLATVLRPGGLVLDGDHFQDDAAAVPTLARLGQVLIEREEQRRFPDGPPSLREAERLVVHGDVTFGDRAHLTEVRSLGTSSTIAMSAAILTAM